MAADSCDSSNIVDASIGTADLSSGLTISGLAMNLVTGITAEIIGGTPFVFEGATDDDIKTNFVITQPTSNRVFTFPDLTGDLVVSGQSSKVSSGMIVDGSVTLAEMNSDSVDSSAIVNAAIAIGDLADNCVDATKLLDSSIDTIDFVADSVDKSKLNVDVAGSGLAKSVGLPIAIDSLAVVSTMFADDSVTKEKIAADVAGTGITQNSDGSLETTLNFRLIFKSSGDTDQFKIRPLKVSGAEIADDALSSSHFSAESISSEHFAASLVTKAKLQTSGFAGTGLVQNVDGSLTLSTSLGAAYIQANSVTTGGILDGSLTAAKFDFTSGFTIAALSTTGTLTLTGSVVVGASPCVFQGTTNNGYTTTWAFVDPTSDWTVVWPTAAGIVVLTGLANSVTSSMITDVTITD
eukprot:79781_1